jgi:hypothetical protein
MSNFSLPINLKPRFSKRFALILMLIYGGALLSLIPVTLPLPVELLLILKLGIGLLILINVFYTVRCFLLFIHHPLYGCVLRYDETESCLRIYLKSGQETQIAPGSYNHRLLVVLRVKGQTKALVIFSDALDIQTFRQLRVHLRHASDPLEKTQW